MNTTAHPFPQSIDWAHLSSVYGPSGLFIPNMDFSDVVEVSRARMVYLATPYSHEVLDMKGQWCAARSELLGFEAANWAAHLAMNGVSTFAPITQAAQMIAADLGRNIDPLDETFWMNWCRPMLVKCDTVIIPPIKGWDQSRGVWQEAWSAVNTNTPVFQIKAPSEYGCLI